VGATPLLFPLEEPASAAVKAPRERTPPARLFADVAVNRPLHCEFTYAVPREMESRLAPGVRVVAPFGSLREVGVVVGLSERCELDPARLRPITRVLDEEPLVGAELLELTRWIGAHYACSWGEALHAILPAALKREHGRRTVEMASLARTPTPEELEEVERASGGQHRLLRTLAEVGVASELRELLKRLKLTRSPAMALARKGWIRLERIPASRDPLLVVRSDRRRPERLTDAQLAAVEAIGGRLGGRRGGAFLLEGVTGSGKTEVYLEVIERALRLGRGAIVLVPEIALTPQTVGWFRSRFERVAVLHSRMSDAQRLEMWLSVLHGEARVVVGARSAVFAPVRDLGVIVVDEEHEPSFKQDNSPRYHARDVALRRAEMAGAVCVLGSATPSLESWLAAREGRIQLLRLPQRASGRALPRVDVVDMRREPPGARGMALFSRLLSKLLEENLERGEQSILFLNRRGFAPILWCSACKETVRCATCDMARTWHKKIRRLVCHACCEESHPPAACPTCTAPRLRFLGAGSERIEEELAQLLPRARVRRMDSDTMRRREDYESTLEAFGRGEIDVLVGTQMIAKGLDFPRVTLVGIVRAEGALHLPDFRASERTFQLVAQVAGRAGRGELEGRIVVQTLAPEHPAIRMASAYDFQGFAEEESRLREELAYPPHGRLVRALLEDSDEHLVADAARRCGDHLRAELRESAASVLGPAPAPIALLRGRHRQHLLVKCPRAGPALDLARSALLAFGAELKRPRLAIDVDPVSMM
jgi:primosomal protein N' (replication factor Y)